MTISISHSEHGAMEFTQDKIELLKQTICKGATNQELELFIHACKRMGLDPFMKQVHAVKRWQEGREVMTIQTGIDGYRLIADRSGKYMPGKETTFVYDEKGSIVSATSYVKKLGPDGQWHEIGATAYFDEYAQKKKDGSLTGMWVSKKHIMLGKCAEAICLRKAFPAELSGIYTNEEMQQADKDEPIKSISFDQLQEIEGYVNGDQELRQKLCGFYKIGSFEDLDEKNFVKVITQLKNRAEKMKVKVPEIEVMKEDPFGRDDK